MQFFVIKSKNQSNGMNEYRTDNRFDLAKLSIGYIAINSSELSATNPDWLIFCCGNLILYKKKR